MSEFYIKVNTSEDNFSIDLSGTYPKVKLESPAKSGRANRELVKRLSDILGEKIGIVSGHKSSRKKIFVDMKEEDFNQRLSEFSNK